jgi:hypothetical protein
VVVVTVETPLELAVVRDPNAVAVGAELEVLDGVDDQYFGSDRSS